MQTDVQIEDLKNSARRVLLGQLGRRPQSLVMFNNQGNSDKHITFSLMAYRVSIYVWLVFGRKLRLPCDLVYENLLDDKDLWKPCVEDLLQNMDSIHKVAQKLTRTPSDQMKDRYDRKAKEKGIKKGYM
ncbi:hypothetical protein ILUMI_16851, partial [Ignelater luminosus]